MEKWLATTKMGELRELAQKLRQHRDSIQAELRMVNDEMAKRDLAALVAIRWNRMSKLERETYAQLAQQLTPEGIESGEKLGNP